MEKPPLNDWLGVIVSVPVEIDVDPMISCPPVADQLWEPLTTSGAMSVCAVVDDWMTKQTFWPKFGIKQIKPLRCHYGPVV